MAVDLTISTIKIHQPRGGGAAEGDATVEVEVMFLGRHPVTLEIRKNYSTLEDLIKQIREEVISLATEMAQYADQLQV